MNRDHVGPYLKPRRKREKAKRDRTEAAVKKQVRAACVERDGYCLVLTRADGYIWQCFGASTWAHLFPFRRSQTRKMPPEVRHSTAHTAMLCEYHHALEERGDYEVVREAPNYANGRVTWRRRQSKVAA